MYFDDIVPISSIDRWVVKFINSDIFNKIETIVVQPFNLIRKYNDKGLHNLGDIDLFEEINITDEQIKRLREDQNCFLFLNLTSEGVGYKFINFYKMLTSSALKNNIPTEKMFLLSGNILEEQYYDIWQKINSPDNKINVFSTTCETFYNDIFSSHKEIFPSIDSTVNYIKQLDDSKLKLFLSFNRAKRPMRTALSLLISKSSILRNTHISYDKFNEDEVIQHINQLSNDILIDSNTIKEFCKNSPSILDLDFDDLKILISHVKRELPVNYFKHSLISVVSETLHDTWDDTSLFYSEKTFKPMMFNHPILLVGQKGLNKSLPLIGYKTYENYFNLDFDMIENHWDRLIAQMNYLECLDDKLNSMDKNQKIKWLLQDVETIEYNKQSLHNQIYTNNFVDKLIKKIKDLI